MFIGVPPSFPPRQGEFMTRVRILRMLMRDDELFQTPTTYNDRKRLRVDAAAGSRTRELLSAFS